MYEGVAILKKATYSSDSALNQTATYTTSEVFVRPKSISRSEFYEAATSEFKPELTLVLENVEDYNGAEIVTYMSTDYKVIRTYQPEGRDTLELTLERKLGNG